jgi:hypothetical protein
LLEGLRAGTRSITDVYYNWPWKTFYIYPSVDGYTEDANWNPVEEKEFRKTVATYPKVRVLRVDMTKEETLNRMKRKAEKGDFPLLARWLPASFLEQCSRDRKERERAAAAALRKEKEKEALHEWVRETWPEEYEEDGFIWKKRMLGGLPGYEQFYPNGTTKPDWLLEKERNRAAAKEAAGVEAPVIPDPSPPAVTEAEKPVPETAAEKKPPAPPPKPDPPPRLYAIL